MRNSIWRVACGSMNFWVRFPEMSKKNQIVSKQVQVYFSPPSQKLHPHAPRCQTCVAVCFKCIPTFSETNTTLMRLGESGASRRNTSSCLCNTSLQRCPIQPRPPPGNARCRALTEYGNSRQSAEIQAVFFFFCLNNGRCSREGEARD